MADLGQIYTRLDETQNEFRLIRVLLGDGDEINCELTLHCQPDATYRALSYCWTESLPTRKIKLNGHDFFVRPNLHEYLKQVNVEEDDSLIFIDALCINQANEAERSSQVQIMGSIYRGAEEVVAWLGIKGVKFSKIDEAMPVLQASIIGDSHESDSFINDMRGLFVAYPLAFAIFNIGYWSRLWVFQELALARVLILQFR